MGHYANDTRDRQGQMLAAGICTGIVIVGLVAIAAMKSREPPPWRPSPRAVRRYRPAQAPVRFDLPPDTNGDGKPDMTPQLQAYLDATRKATQTLVSGVEQLDEAGKKLVMNPSLIQDYDWRFETGFAVGLIAAAGVKYANLPPPTKEAITLHGYCQQTGGVASSFANQFATSFDKGDIDGLERSLATLEQLQHTALLMATEADRLEKACG